MDFAHRAQKLSAMQQTSGELGRHILTGLTYIVEGKHRSEEEEAFTVRTRRQDAPSNVWGPILVVSAARPMRATWFAGTGLSPCGRRNGSSSGSSVGSSSAQGGASAHERNQERPCPCVGRV